MRFQITFLINDTLTLPIDHGYLLRDQMFRILARGDQYYADWLRESGYVVDGESYSMFGISPLRAYGERRAIEGTNLRIAPGQVTWFVSSPIPFFAETLQEGLKRSSQIEIAGASLEIADVRSRPFPRLHSNSSGEAMPFHCTCLSPIAFGYECGRGENPGCIPGTTETQESNGAKMPMVNRRPYFVRPNRKRTFEENLYEDLRRKHMIVTGKTPARQQFTLSWDEEYLQRSRRSGSKRIAIEGENGPVVDGRLAPFTLVTTSDLMQTAYDCGLGTYNSYGLGMIGFAEGARTHA